MQDTLTRYLQHKTCHTWNGFTLVLGFWIWIIIQYLHSEDFSGLSSIGLVPHSWWRVSWWCYRSVLSYIMRENLKTMQQKCVLIMNRQINVKAGITDVHQSDRSHTFDQMYVFKLCKSFASQSVLGSTKIQQPPPPQTNILQPNNNQNTPPPPPETLQQHPPPNQTETKPNKQTKPTISRVGKKRAPYSFLKLEIRRFPHHHLRRRPRLLPWFAQAPTYAADVDLVRRWAARQSGPWLEWPELPMSVPVSSTPQRLTSRTTFNSLCHIPHHSTRAV